MFCSRFDNKTKKWVALTMILVGLVAVAAGVFWFGRLAEANPNLDRLTGLISGAGGGLTAVGVIQLYNLKRMTPDVMHKKEVERHDERNIQINRAALSVVAAASFFILVILTFLFTALDYGAAGMICAAMLYVQIAVYIVAYNRISKRT